VNCTIHNVIVGKLWIEQYGTMEITNHQTGHKAVLHFKPSGSGHKDLHRIEGTVQDKVK
jgi:oxysterol-binding protein-related protein 1/2